MRPAVLCRPAAAHPLARAPARPRTRWPGCGERGGTPSRRCVEGEPRPWTGGPRADPVWPERGPAPVRPKPRSLRTPVRAPVARTGSQGQRDRGAGATSGDRRPSAALSPRATERHASHLRRAGSLTATHSRQAAVAATRASVARAGSRRLPDPRHVCVAGRRGAQPIRNPVNVLVLPWPSSFRMVLPEPLPLRSW